MNVIIVDDEFIIRKGIHGAIPWGEIGITGVFEAAAGMEALETIDKEKIDIVITDIQMAEMTGLDLISEIKKRNEEIKIIVLTGYDEFDYARQCLRMRVDDFLLKPVDEEVLINSLQKQIFEFRKKQINLEEERKMRRVTGTKEQMKLESNLRLLLKGKVSDEIIRNIGEHTHFPTNRKIRIVILIPSIYAREIKKGEALMLSILTIKNLLIGFLDAQGRGITLIDEASRIVLMVYDGGKGDELENTLNSVIKFIKVECDVSLRIVKGNVVEHLEEISMSYNDALYLLEKEQEQFRTYLTNKEVRNQAEMFHEVYFELKQNLNENIGNTEAILRVLKAFQSATNAYNINDASVRRYCFELASSIYYSYIAESGEKRSSKLDALQEALMNTKREENYQITYQYIENLLKQGDEEANEIIQEAKCYIREHLTEDISVSGIAERFYLSPNYFSRLFKKVTNERCNEYIVRKRVERAKQLLTSTNLKVGRIAQDIGYRDTNYFSLSFKKATNLSPLQYREKYR